MERNFINRSEYNLKEPLPLDGESSIGEIKAGDLIVLPNFNEGIVIKKLGCSVWVDFGIMVINQYPFVVIEGATVFHKL